MDFAPLSLYIDLEKDQKADLEVVARAALAFSAAVNEIAFVIDPSLTIRVELSSGSEGSLSLNTLIKAINKHLKPKSPITLPAIVLTVLSWFAADIRSAVDIDLFHKLIGFDQEKKLSSEEQEQIRAIVQKALAGRVGRDHIQGVYRALESDPAVKGVGSTTVPGARPVDIVPRAEFSQRSGLDAQDEIAVPKREKRERVSLTLVSPVLVASLTRKWRFESPDGLISAPIKDVAFLSRLLSGQERVPMKANIVMDVLLETSEEKRDDIWTVTARSILQVTNVRPATVHPDLFSSPAEEDEGDQ